MLDPPSLPNHSWTSSGLRWYGTGRRYSISCRAISVSVPASMPESSTAVGGASSSTPGRQNARTRTSSSSLSIDALFTWLNASRSPHLRWIGMCSRCENASTPSVTCELAVRRPVGIGRVRAEPLDLVLLVSLEVALEPVPLIGVVLRALVGEDVRRDAVEDPPVVGDH